MKSENLASLLVSLESGSVAVHPERCIRVRNRHAGCHRCVDACPAGAIGLVDGELTADPARCIGCGNCATACPTSTFTANDPNDVRLFASACAAMAKAGGTAVFSDVPTYGNQAVTVKSLGRVSEFLVVRLARAGAREVDLVHLAAGDKQGAALAQEVCASANSILAAWGSSVEARVTQVLPSGIQIAPTTADGTGASAPAASTPGTGLRQPTLAADAAKSASASPAKAAFKKLRVMKDGSLPHFVPDDREALTDLLYEMGDPVQDTVESRLWGHVVIDQAKCTECRMCAVFCPTGALARFDDGQGRSGIEHSPSDCMKCLCCHDVCRAGAVTVQDAVGTSVIMEGTVERFYMQPQQTFKTDGDSILAAIKKTSKTDRVYLR